MYTQRIETNRIYLHQLFRFRNDPTQQNISLHEKVYHLFLLPPSLSRKELRDDLSSFGLASTTLILLPSTVAESSSAIAFFAASLSGISTKPNPLDCPLNLSLIIFEEVTSP